MDGNIGGKRAKRERKDKKMKINSVKRIAFLSTYPPKECGLATFTEDLVNAIDENAENSFVKTSIMAMTKNEEYTDPRVEFQVKQEERSSYMEAAVWANTHVDLVIIEHEYGIFGGIAGEYVIDFAKELQIPFIVTTHTVLLRPTSKQRSVLRELGKLSTKVVTMAESSIPVLKGSYDIAGHKIMFIPHGVPSMKMVSREQLKSYYPALKNKQIISSFGLISPAKGLEYGIQALAKVVKQYDDVIYLILGKTHPTVKEKMGEAYRQSLMDLAETLGVRDHVQFVDKYLTKEEVITYLQLSDMYLTPYLSAEQAVSGTLAYAMGYGRVIISTPYRYAQEMLGEGRGLLARFRDEDSLADCIRTVLGNPERKADMEIKTMAVGRTMTWENVANQYVKLCIKTIDENGASLPSDTQIPMVPLEKKMTFSFNKTSQVKGMKA